MNIDNYLKTGDELLLIGVVDDGLIYGIENDMKTLKGKPSDAFHKSLIALNKDYLGAEFSGFVSINFEQKKGKTIFIEKIESSPKAYSSVKQPARSSMFVSAIPPTSSTSRLPMNS